MPKRALHKKTVLVTGGAGFIGSNFCRYWLSRHPQDKLINLDLLTYAGNLSSCQDFQAHPHYSFVHGDINDRELIDRLVADVDVIIHFAAESHVDRSISDPSVFLQTNILGTHTLLQAALKHNVRHFHHISTDEAFGSLSLDTNEQFSETTPYSPRSPYSASKAASDHLVRAYGETYGLPYTITNCSNNYGEYQFPEKFMALAITNLLESKNVPVYGNGAQIRDWLYVQDHCSAIDQVVQAGPTQQTYLVGGLKKEYSNLEIAKLILSLMGFAEDRLTFVADRPGHDQRYSVNWQHIHDHLGWSPSVSLEEGLRKTIEWYQQRPDWWQPLKTQQQAYFARHYQGV